MQSFIRCFIRNFIRSFIRSFMRSFMQSFMQSFIPCFIRSFIRSWRDRRKSLKNTWWMCNYNMKRTRMNISFCKRNMRHWKRRVKTILKMWKQIAIIEKDKKIVSQRKTTEEYESLFILIKKTAEAYQVTAPRSKAAKLKISTRNLKEKVVHRPTSYMWWTTRWVDKRRYDKVQSLEDLQVICDGPLGESTNVDMIRCNLWKTYKLYVMDH